LSGRRIIRRAEVRRRTGYSDTQRWRLEQEEKFPKRVLLNPDVGPQGGVGWFEDEVDAWVRARVRGVNRPLPIKGGRKPKAETQNVSPKVAMPPPDPPPGGAKQ
jgi:predicted DNA-binding transcriptional regulator AlpA